ncbi:hypothetical protein OROGR_017357 [Orobanche gracilis]
MMGRDPPRSSTHHTSPELTSRDKMVFEQGYGSWELNAYAWTYNRNYS